MAHAPAGTVRTRFAPSPTGYLHIGGARTALFNWLLARRHGGAFILRIEDTDVERNLPDADAQLMEDLRWLGLGWDEGPGLGGPRGPYRQSERLDLYRSSAARLLDAGHAYYAFETPGELDAMRAAAQARRRPFRYSRPARRPSAADADRARAEGRPVVVRLCVPNQEFIVHDLVLGDVTFRPGEVEDFVILKSNGWPTYHFAVVVDDEAMEITHVLRAQEHLMNTPKHLALQACLGCRVPAYAHLPLVFNLDGSKMSKRDKEKDVAGGRPPREIDVHDFRAAGYLPEAIVNFIALIGWSPGGDREKLTREEMIELFSIEGITKTSGRFDREKLLAFNTDYAAAAPPDRLREAFRDYARLADSPLSGLDEAALAAALDACRGLRTFRDVDVKIGPLFVPDEQVTFDPDSVRKVLEKNGGKGYAVLEQLLPSVAAAEPWTAERIDALIREFCERHGAKLADVAQPVRVALTGRTISPAIGQTLVLAGRERTLARLRRCLDRGGRA